MVKPADSSMRSSRSTKRHASWRAKSVPTVVLPEPMNPARHRIGTRSCGPRKGGVVVTRSRREKLVALQNANCTTVGGEFDFGEALPDGAEKAIGEFLCQVFDAVGIGCQVRGGLIVEGADGGLRLQVKGIVAREANFDETLAALHGIETGANEIAVKEDISRSGEEADVGQRRLENLGAAADRLEIQLAGALRADKRTFRGADNDIARYFLQVDIAGDAFQGHVAHDLLNVNKPRLRLELQFRFFVHGEQQTRFQLAGLRRGVQNTGGGGGGATRLPPVKGHSCGRFGGRELRFSVAAV